jgi:hypothetical protein
MLERRSSHQLILAVLGLSPLKVYCESKHSFGSRQNLNGLGKSRCRAFESTPWRVGSALITDSGS